MLVTGALEKAKFYLESRTKEQVKKISQGPCITISRQTGAGADVVSQLLADYLEEYNTAQKIKWTIFYRNLIEKVIEDHNFPATIKELMKEDKYSHVNNLLQELLTGYPGYYTIESKTAETILRLGSLGNVIIVGRGSNIITSKLNNTLHVRLIAPFEKRVTHVQEVYDIQDRNNAVDFTRKEDEARKKYVKTLFHKDIEENELYHLVLNTGNLGYQASAEIIGNAVIKKSH
jgi:cytidylate kinase